MKDYIRLVRNHLRIRNASLIGILVGAIALGCGSGEDDRIKGLEKSLEDAKKVAQDALTKMEDFRKDPPKGPQGEKGLQGEKGTDGSGGATKDEIERLGFYTSDEANGLFAKGADFNTLEGIVNDGTNGLTAVAGKINTLEGIVNDGTNGLTAVSTALDGRINTLETEVSDGTTGLTAVGTKLATLQTQVGTVDVATLDGTVTALQTQVDALDQKIDDKKGGGLEEKVNTLEKNLTDDKVAAVGVEYEVSYDESTKPNIMSITGKKAKK